MQININDISVGIDSVFVTSDNHFFHGNIIKYCDRPFCSWKEMNETMIERWNKVVGNDQIVFCLGDLIFRHGIKESKANTELLDRLNGRIFLVKGNHDSSKIYNWSRFEWVKDYYELSTDFNQLNIVMSHYPFLSWNHQYRKSIHLHGHIHSKEPMLDKSVRRIDVGVDAWTTIVETPYSPTPLKQVIDYVKKNYKEAEES